MGSVAGVDFDRRRAAVGVAKREDALPRRPGGPAVDLQLSRIAAHPVRIDEHVGVLAASERTLPGHPSSPREELGRDVHLLHLRPAAEKRSHLGREITLGIDDQLVGVPGEDHSMQHERIERYIDRLQMRGVSWFHSQMRYRDPSLRQNLPHHIGLHDAGQLLIEPLEAIGQPLVVDAECTEDRGGQVADVDADFR